ncbi:MotA/TolQ/ExbB proton channel family protein [Anaplasma phagocytophilum]|uniref:MotA/TolQ/ExbB proton channel family protein n=1 Tax=Anaplasma phagocytophilum str. ApNP TaxID=1359153 RepID=A0A0F3NF80_ANAPH|nr:motA/TolQ/ExbB proton channel family protein [Anaplasma phagocytophilum str. ApNP]
MEEIAESAVHIQNGVSAFDVFAEASIVVRLVMLVLLAFSLVSWAIIFKKCFVINRHKRELHDVEVVFNSRGTALGIREIVECGSGVVAKILQHGIKHAQQLRNKKEGFHRAINSELTRAVDKLEEQLGLLSAIGSSAPYIGLLGTLWKVIESFRAVSIGESQQIASVLYPYMAGALYTLALGLLVAIPAQLFYNGFSAYVTKLSHRLGNLVYELSAFVTNEECASDSSFESRDS